MESQQTYNLSRNFSASAAPRAKSPSKYESGAGGAPSAHWSKLPSDASDGAMTSSASSPIDAAGNGQTRMVRRAFVSGAPKHLTVSERLSHAPTDISAPESMIDD